METPRTSARSQKRLVRRVGVDQSWMVQEVDCRLIPGSGGPSCLVFESPEVVRRLWHFPTQWHELDDASLSQLAEMSPAGARHMDALAPNLGVVIRDAMAILRRSRELVGATHVSARESEQRLTRETRVRECRAEQKKLRVAIESYARDLHSGGVSEAEASWLVARVVRDRQALRADGGLERSLRDADRWCVRIYRAI